MSLRKTSADNTYTYFRYTLKNNWQHFVFYAILSILCVVFPTVTAVNEYHQHSYHSDGDDLMIVMAVVTFVLSCAVALFAGMSSLSYVNSKQAVGCFHSFPVTRKTIFLTDSAVKGIYYLVTVGSSVILSYLIMELNFKQTAEARLFFWQMIVLSLFAFALFYAIVLFAAGLTGTGLLRFLMAGLVVALPIALYSLICFAASLGMPNITFDRYWDFAFIKWLCPITFLADIVIRLAEDSENILFGWSLILVLLPTALFYGAAYVLHLKRKSESSGTSIIWKPVFAIIKYTVIFSGSLCGILFFGGVTGGDVLWLTFGGIAGLLLAFMLSNVILYRSVRTMFKGVKGLAVMAVVMGFFTAFTVYDAAGINEHVYTSANTKSLTVNVGDIEVTYTDEEDLSVIVPLLRTCLEEYGQYRYNDIVADGFIPGDEKTAGDIQTYLGDYLYSKKYYYEEELYEGAVTEYYPEEGIVSVEYGKPIVTVNETYPADLYWIFNSVDSIRIHWEQVPKLGIPSYREINTDAVYVRSHELLDYILSTDEISAAVTASIDELCKDPAEVMFRFFGTDDSIYFSGSQSISLAKKIQASYSFSPVQRKESVAIGTFSIWSGTSWDSIRFPVYADDVAMLNLMAEALELEVRFETEADVMTYLLDQTEAMFLIERKTGRTRSLEREEQEVLYGCLADAIDTYNTIPDPMVSDRFAACIVLPSVKADDGEWYGEEVRFVPVKAIADETALGLME